MFADPRLVQFGECCAEAAVEEVEADRVDVRLALAAFVRMGIQSYSRSWSQRVSARPLLPM